MWVRVEIRNRFGDYLGDLHDVETTISEYEAYPLSLALFSDEPADRFAIEVGETTLPRRQNRFRLKADSGNNIGRRGEILVRILFDENHVRTGFIQIRNGNLSEAQYRYLVRDIQSLISLASVESTDVTGHQTRIQQESIEMYDSRLHAIENYLVSFADNLRDLTLSPQRTIIKDYHLDFPEKVRRIDARTIQWNALHSAQSSNRVLTLRKIESHDLYENRLIVFVLHRLKQYLLNLELSFAHSLDRRLNDFTHRLVDFSDYAVIGSNKDEERLRADFKQKQIEALQRNISYLEMFRVEKLPTYRHKIAQCLNRIDHLVKDSFLAQVTHVRDLTVSPTLPLLRDPLYSRFFSGYQQLQQTLRIDEQEKLESLLEQVPVERTSKLYEYWIFLQVLIELKRMGFEGVPGKGIWEMVNAPDFKLRSGSFVELIGNSAVYQYAGKVPRVRVYYEYRIGSQEHSVCPDIFIEFELDSKRVLILDAKYRNYLEQGDETYSEDVDNTAYRKYRRLEYKTIGGWQPLPELDLTRETVCASFIVHSCQDERYTDYGSNGHRNEYGAIPLVPEEPKFNPTPLKRLLKMFMRMHLNILDVCWSEAHDSPVRAKRITQKPNREGHYCCTECGNRWWVNHCGHWCQGDGNLVRKITFSDPSDNFFEFDPSLRITERQVLKCSSCGKGYVHRR